MGAGWLVGVAINLVGSVLINLGTNVMKLGHNKLAAINWAEDISSRTPIRKIREWQIGVALFSLGNIANFVSFGYAAQSLLSAIGCIQFVSNVFFASFVLKEQVSAPVICAIACIVGGCILLVSFGSHTSQTYTYRDLLRLYGQPAYVSYMCIGGAVIVVAYAAYWKGSKVVDTKGPHVARVWAALLPILYCLFSAIIGTQSVLFSKTLAVLLRATVSGDNQLGKWFTWLVLPAFFVTAAFWVTRLNKGLKMFPAMVIVPNLQISWTLFSILSGMLYFQEYQDMRSLHVAMFVLGVSVVFLGVFLLTKASVPKGPADSRGALVADLGKAKIAYTQHADDDHLHIEQAVELGGTSASAEFARLIQAKVAGSQFQQPAEAEQKIGVAAQELPLSQGSFLRGFATLHPVLHPDLDLDDDFEVPVGQQEDERSLLGGTSSLLPPAATGIRSSFNISRVLAGGLQQLWPNSSSRHGSSNVAGHTPPGIELSGQGVQVMPDFAATGIEGVAEAATMQRQHQRRRLHNNISSLSKHVANDFDLDETAAARLSLGLGDSGMPGVSLFTMPMIDIHSTQAKASSTARLLDRRYGVLPDHSQGGVVHSQNVHVPWPVHGLSNTEVDGDGTIGASAIAAIRSLNKEQEGPGVARGINPLSNAIEVSNIPAAPHEAALTGLLTTVKQNIKDIQANIKDLAANRQTASQGRNYARMDSKEDSVGEQAAYSTRENAN